MRINKLLIPLLFLISCNSENSNEKAIKESISHYVSDEIFSNNSNFELIEIKLNNIQSLTLDSLFRDQLKTRIYTLMSQLEETERDRMRQDGYVKYMLDNDEDYKRLNKISIEKGVKFGTDKKGTYAYAYVKGVIKHKSSSQNLLLENSFFVLDENNKVIMSYVNWNYFKER
ncbi:MAG: hypothetical protein ABIR78_13160 [Ferruginibacter sp.]